MDSKASHPKDYHAPRGCCGGAQGRAAKQEKKEAGCGCGDKHVDKHIEEKSTSSCCG